MCPHMWSTSRCKTRGIMFRHVTKTMPQNDNALRDIVRLRGYVFHNYVKKDYKASKKLVGVYKDSSFIFVRTSNLLVQLSSIFISDF